jgi:hypothetical protein
MDTVQPDAGKAAEARPCNQAKFDSWAPTGFGSPDDVSVSEPSLNGVPLGKYWLGTGVAAAGPPFGALDGAMVASLSFLNSSLTSRG